MSDTRPPEALRPTQYTDALRVIRSICDMDLDERRADFGDEHRVLIVSIPAIIADALGEEPLAEGYRRLLFRHFSYLGFAAHPVPDSGPATDDLATAAAFMLELVDQYYGTDHEFDIPEEAQFRYHRAVIEEATR